MTYIIAEIGQNHNGSMELASELIRAASSAGANAVKFQKRSLPDCIPVEQRGQMRVTPWGTLTYEKYREHLEFSWEQLLALKHYAGELRLDCFVSVWDVQSAREISADWCAVKIPSAKLTDTEMLQVLIRKHMPRYYLSTGMSTETELVGAISELWSVYEDKLVILHCHSGYPAPEEELNLRYISSLVARFGASRVGYSGHEAGTLPTVAAVALGATVIERHLTLDHSMWGSDHASSLEQWQFSKMVKSIRRLEAALGTGEKRVWASEESKRQSLRGPASESTLVAI